MDKIKKTCACDYKLIDNAPCMRYEFHIEHYVPRIEYTKNKKGRICFTHTEVPEPLCGKGIASELVEQSLRDVDRQGLKLIPSCSFVAAYIKRHPDWERLLDDDFFL